MPMLIREFSATSADSDNWLPDHAPGLGIFDPYDQAFNYIRSISKHKYNQDYHQYSGLYNRLTQLHTSANGVTTLQILSGLSSVFNHEGPKTLLPYDDFRSIAESFVEYAPSPFELGKQLGKIIRRQLLNNELPVHINMAYQKDYDPISREVNDYLLDNHVELPAMGKLIRKKLKRNFMFASRDPFMAQIADMARFGAGMTVDEKRKTIKALLESNRTTRSSYKEQKIRGICKCILGPHIYDLAITNQYTEDELLLANRIGTAERSHIWLNFLKRNKLRTHENSTLLHTFLLMNESFDDLTALLLRYRSHYDFSSFMSLIMLFAASGILYPRDESIEPLMASGDKILQSGFIAIHKFFNELSLADYTNNSDFFDFNNFENNLLNIIKLNPNFSRYVLDKVVSGFSSFKTSAKSCVIFLMSFLNDQTPERLHAIKTQEQQMREYFDKWFLIAQTFTDSASLSHYYSRDLLDELIIFGRKFKSEYYTHYRDHIDIITTITDRMTEIVQSVPGHLINEVRLKIYIGLHSILTCRPGENTRTFIENVFTNIEDIYDIGPRANHRTILDYEDDDENIYPTLQDAAGREGVHTLQDAAGRQGVHKIPRLEKYRNLHAMYSAKITPATDVEIRSFLLQTQMENSTILPPLVDILIQTRSPFLIMAFYKHPYIRKCLIKAAEHDPEIKPWFIRLAEALYANNDKKFKERLKIDANAKEDPFNLWYRNKQSTILEWYIEVKSTYINFQDRSRFARITHLSMSNDYVHTQFLNAKKKNQWIESWLNTVNPDEWREIFEAPGGMTWEQHFNLSDGLEFCREQGLLSTHTHSPTILDDQIYDYDKHTIRHALQLVWCASKDSVRLRDNGNSSPDKLIRDTQREILIQMGQIQSAYDTESALAHSSCVKGAFERIIDSLCITHVLFRPEESGVTLSQQEAVDLLKEYCLQTAFNTLLNSRELHGCYEDNTWSISSVLWEKIKPNVIAQILAKFTADKLNLSQQSKQLIKEQANLFSQVDSCILEALTFNDAQINALDARHAFGQSTKSLHTIVYQLQETSNSELARSSKQPRMLNT